VWLWPVGVALALALAWFLRPALPPPEVTGITQITRDGSPKTEHQWVSWPLFGDGSRIYFQEATAKQTLLQVSTDGGETVPVDSRNEFHGYLEGSWPEGSELLSWMYAAARSQNSAALSLWRLSLPDLQQRRIGNLSLEVDNDLVGFGAAAWSRDGRLLYYGSHSDIFAANADGSNPRKLLTTTGQPFWLRASPDGRILRFSVANVSSGAQTLWEARSNGSGPRQLFPALDNGANVCCGNWTADGKYFIFETTHGSVSTLWARRDAGTFGAKSAASPRSSPTVT
jgi:hypothetical protein